MLQLYAILPGISSSKDAYSGFQIKDVCGVMDPG